MFKTKKMAKELKRLCNQSSFIDYNTEALAPTYVIEVINKVTNSIVVSETILEGEEYLLGTIRAKFNNRKYEVVVR